MPRKLNRPFWGEPLPGTAGIHTWEPLRTVYPVVQSYHIHATTIEDPFSPYSAGRTATRTVVDLPGLGAVDLGWLVTGEPRPELPFVFITVSGHLLEDFAQNWATNKRRVLGNLKGATWHSWVTLHGTLKLTVLGVVYMLGEHLDWPKWSHWLRDYAADWDFANGIPNRLGRTMPNLSTAFDSAD